MAQFTLIGRVTCDRKCRREKGGGAGEGKGKAGRRKTAYTSTRHANATSTSLVPFCFEGKKEIFYIVSTIYERGDGRVVVLDRGYRPTSWHMLPP